MVHVKLRRVHDSNNNTGQCEKKSQCFFPRFFILGQHINTRGGSHAWPRVIAVKLTESAHIIGLASKDCSDIADQFWF
jgi:hypothetical protein